MTEHDGQILDRCSVLDVLEEAVVRKTPVELVLRDGEMVTADVAEVVTRAGEDWAVLSNGRRIAVSELALATPVRS